MNTIYNNKYSLLKKLFKSSDHSFFLMFFNLTIYLAWVLFELYNKQIYWVPDRPSAFVHNEHG